MFYVTLTKCLKCVNGGGKIDITHLPIISAPMVAITLIEQTTECRLYFNHTLCLTLLKISQMHVPTGSIYEYIRAVHVNTLIALPSLTQTSPLISSADLYQVFVVRLHVKRR